MADDDYSRGNRNDRYGRPAPSPSAPATDPLTELARLIGQSDPFAPGPRRHDAPTQDPHAREWQDEAHDRYAEHARRDDGYGNASDARHGDSRYTDARYADDRYAHADAGNASQGHADPHGYGDQRYSDEQYAHAAAPVHHDGYHSGHPDDGQDYEAEYYDDEQDDRYEEEPAPRRRSGLITVAALAGVAVLGTAGAFAYRTVFATSSGGEVRVIRPEAGPSKIVPTAQNTDTNTKQIRDRVADSGQNERVVPREEQPVNIQDPARAAIGVTPGPFAALPGGPPVQAPAPATTSAIAPAPSGGVGEPRKVPTIRIPAPSQGAGSQAAPPPRSAAPAQAPAPQVASPPRANAAPPPSPNAPLSLAPSEVVASVPPQPTAPPAHVPPPQAAAPATGSSGYFVQVSAQKSEEEAQSSFRGIQARHASVLGGHELVIRRKDLGAKGVFYGAQVGPLSRDDAVKMCETLKSTGQTCMVQRN